MNKKNIVLAIIIIILGLITVCFCYKYYEKVKEENAKKIAELELKQKEEKVLKLLDGKINGRIFLNSEIKDNDNGVRTELEKKKYITNLEFISKEQALEFMKKQFKENSSIFDGYEGENNIFPVSYTFSIKINSFDDLISNYLQEIEEELNQIKNVDRVSIYDYGFKRNYEYHGIDESLDRLEESIKEYEKIYGQN